MEKTKTIRTKTVILCIVLALVLLLAVFAVTVILDITGAVGSEEKVSFTIKEGDTLSDIADGLAAEGIVDQSLYFKLYIKLFKPDFMVQFGSCELSSSMSYGELIDVLSGVSTNAKGIVVTIPEGYNMFDIAAVMEKAGICTADEFIEECRNGDFSRFWFIADAEQNEYRYSVVEGYLFPDTYEFPTDSTAHSVIEDMMKNFDVKVGDDLREKAQSIGMTPDQVVILASVIQCEVGGITAEETKVSSVFHNRLDSSYKKLESDPTIFYGNELKEMDPSVTEEQQEAYSTYVSVGLPAGAISNPGISSIEAALAPADTDYYFFVTDCNSVFYYAKTYEEHLKNIAHTKTVEKK